MPTGGSIITTLQAVAYTTKFRTDYPNNNKGYFIDSGMIGQLLHQTGPAAVGIRVYLGETSDTVPQIIPIMVAVDSSGNDIIGICVDEMNPCPPECSATGPLK